MVTGEMLIAGRSLRGLGTPFHALAAATGAVLQPAFGGSTAADVETACAAAWAAFDDFRERPAEGRARFLEAIAEAILALADPLIERCMSETGLPRARLEGERGRTVNQLRMFAGLLRDGGSAGLHVDPALPDRKPLPRPDLRRRNLPLGPVAVFGASNFPLAFSVAGGDTASALAAGCPVVVKAHPAHPGTSELVGQAIRDAAEGCGMPAGVFSLLFDGGLSVGQALAAHPRIAAVAFTGSRRGGEALMRIAAERPVPVPVFAEMGSLNPVILLPGALAERGAEIGRAFASSLTMGVGQFCTNPGLILAMPGAGLDAFTEAAAAALAGIELGPMLTPSISAAFCRGTETLAAHAETLGHGLFAASAKDFRADPHLREEVFGPASLIVRCRDLAEMGELLEELEGQLCAALHLAPADHPAARSLLPILERKAGRILVNGFGTGVEVCAAMVHGGPYPATSDGRGTSVGTLAIERFLRPVCYQDLPPDLLPASLRD